MDKKYTDKFIPLKDDEVSALSKLTNKSTFEELKKVGEMKKVLDTIKEIYKSKISLKSLRYLKILSTVRKFQLNAFKDLPEVKKLLSKNVKEKLKGRRGRAIRGKAPRDAVDKIISESTKKEDPLTKLMKDILKSKSASDLESAIKNYANIFCQSGVQNLIKSNALGKVFTDMFTVIKQNVNNVIFEGKIGFDNSGWNASKEFMNILTTGLACLTQLKPVFDFFKNLFKRAFRIVSTPFRRGDRPPNPSSGRGDGPDDDDGPPPPSTFDRQQRNRLNELFRQQQASIEAGIVGASTQQQPPAGAGTTGGTPPPTSGGTSGFSFADYFSNLFSGSTQQPPPTGSGPQDDRAGDPTNDAPAGAVAIIPQASGRRTIIPEPFTPPSGTIPSLEPLPDIIGPQPRPPEKTAWDPYNIAAGAAFLVGAARFFTNPIQPPQGGMEQQDSGAEPLPRDDGLGFEDEFQREEFEMEEAEKARQEAEQEDEQEDIKKIMPPPSSVEIAGSLFGGSKVIPASSYDAVRAAQLASKIFTQMASGINQVDTIDESVELKDALTNQQVIEFDIQNQLINQMTQPPPPTEPAKAGVSEELMFIEELSEEILLTIELVEKGQAPFEQADELITDVLDFINDILTEIPKEETDSEEIRRLRTLRATLIQSRNDLINRGVDKLKLQSDLLNQREQGVASIERSIERKQGIVKDLKDQTEIIRDRTEQDTRRNLSSLQTENYMNRERKRIVESVLDSGSGHSQAISSLERLSNMYMSQLNREQKEIMTKNIREAIDTINRSRQTTALTTGVVRNQVLRNIAQRTNQNRAQQERLARQRGGRQDRQRATESRLDAQRKKLEEKRKRIQSKFSDDLNLFRAMKYTPEVFDEDKLVVSPTLAGLPLPYQPIEQGGALIPSREPSLETLPPPTEPQGGDPMRRALSMMREGAEARIQDRGRERVEALARAREGLVGAGRPRDLFKLITGNSDATVDQTRLIFRQLGRRFRFNGGQLFDNFLKNYSNLLYQNNNKFYAAGRKKIEDILLDQAQKLGIPIEKFYSRI
jgi:hypothetical protein